ncbi:hybrid sensor histidine kinase/response regulator [Phenylobacterium sp.]|uniref:hybrid sensor histidine kinase/response regulator n=1 Tax=Phenylobacterium sp. TaxID=1871053 RepID=UPI002E2FE3C4|nr:ATP-binding protein [Phenylobacterium sp.]HEX3365940.1 ATP-binding protein [Phenylobacterium sp.]
MLRLFDQGLDEMAAGARASFWPRLAATLGVAAIALALLPWPVCLVWAAFVGGLDLVSWFITRDQFLGRPVNWSSRLQHVGCLVGGVVGWVTLGVLFWRTGTAVGAICGVATWLSVMSFAQVYAYQSRAGYLLAGVIPAAAMLITPLVWPSSAVTHSLPAWLFLAVGVAFSVSGAQQTMAARNRYEKATQALRDSEQSYRLLADNVTDVISLSSANQERLYVSPSIERILKFSPGELLQTPNYKHMHPDDTEATQAFIRSVSVETGPQTMDYRVIAKDGSVIWAETTFTRLNDGSGRLLAVSRDVTGRKALEDELKEALARAEGAAAAKTDFLANMTHELRTPLTAIVGFAGVLRDSPSISERDARHAGLIHDASKTLLGVVGDVLDFSKLEAGGFELDPAPFDPAATVRSAAEIVAEQAFAKGLALTTYIAEPPPSLVGDAPRLRQVLLNFLSNAVKFTREGGVDLILTQSLLGELCRLRVEVIDTGIGIEQAHIGALFNRFTQADASVSRQFGGTGLGLAISKQIVEAMGGRIGAASVIGKGSTFWFELDLPVAAEGAARAEPKAAGAALDRPIRALVVEDNAVNRELIATLLSPFGIEIDTACDGAEAVEAVGRGRYDIILMDVQMPVMDGLTATRRIRALADREAARTPIIAMTANVLPEQVARCREAGMDDHIGKPINLPQLLEALDRWTTPVDDGDAGQQTDASA